MPKDPAFLFYPADWLTGTMTLNRHQKGCYMDLLIAQFNNGPLSSEAIKTILGQDQAAWTVLSRKFIEDSAGNFFNERLAAEIEKRKIFTDSRRENGEKGGRPKKPNGYPYGKPTQNLAVNVNENENENKDRGLGEGFFSNEISKNMELTNIEILAVQEFIAITAKTKLSEKEVKDYWQAFKINQFALKEWYNNRESLLKHFRHSLKLELKNESNGNSKTSLKNGSGLPGNAVIRPGKTFERTLRH